MMLPIYNCETVQRFAAMGGIYGNVPACGVVGKPDHDGDPAVHYALLTVTDGEITATIQRVEYDHLAWVETLEQEGVDRIFVEPFRTGFWTTGVSSLPA